jgi:hypothetical protein
MRTLSPPYAYKCTLPGIEKAQIQPQEFAGIPGQLRFDIEHRPGDQFKPGMIQVLRLAPKNAHDNVEMFQTHRDDLELCILWDAKFDCNEQRLQ